MWLQPEHYKNFEEYTLRLRSFTGLNPNLSSSHIYYGARTLVSDKG